MAYLLPWLNWVSMLASWTLCSSALAHCQKCVRPMLPPSRSHWTKTACQRRSYASVALRDLRPWTGISAH